MKIVFFSHYFPPEVNAPASRTYEHCRHWVEAGHEVTVVTSAPNHPTGEVYKGYRNVRFHCQAVDGIKVVRIWTWLAANKGVMRRIANYISFMVSAWSILPRLERPDVIVSTSPQFFCGLAGWGAKLFWHRPWVLEVRDLWPESIVAVGAMRRGLLISALGWLETHAYRNADLIVSVTGSFVPDIVRRARDSEKVKIVKNGVDLELFDPSRVDCDQAKVKIAPKDQFVVAYVGTHGLAHGLETILLAAKRLLHRADISFLFVGDGAERRKLETRAREMGLPNVLITGQLPKEAMPDIWAASDASVIHLKRSDTFKKVLPSKLFEAMAMERPIVLGVEGEAHALLEQASAGIFVTPENAIELADAVLRLADNPRLASDMGKAGGAFVRAHYDRRHLAKSYLCLLHEIAIAQETQSGGNEVTQTRRAH